MVRLVSVIRRTVLNITGESLIRPYARDAVVGHRYDSVGNLSVRRSVRGPQQVVVGVLAVAAEQSGELVELALRKSISAIVVGIATETRC